MAFHLSFFNTGYYVNITLIEEIREKVLKYLTVMSRPVNMKADYNYVPVWSYLYVDLADRRQTNWLWKKLEGIRQREVFLDFAKRQMIQENWVFGDGIKNHMLLMESHVSGRVLGCQIYIFFCCLALPRI